MGVEVSDTTQAKDSYRRLRSHIAACDIFIQNLFHSVSLCWRNCDYLSSFSLLLSHSFIHTLCYLTLLYDA